MPAIARRVLMDFFQEISIPQSQMLTIMALYEQSPCRLTQLSGRMKVTAPTITGLVDRLEKGGYARRIPDVDDRRAVNVVLTAKGKSIAEKMRNSLAGKWNEILGELSLAEARQFVEIARKIRESIA